MKQRNEKNEDYMIGIGANERAIINKIPVLFIRKIVVKIILTKIKLQFTGWLQYLLPLIFVLFFSMIGVVIQLINLNYLSMVFYSIAMLFLFIIIFDLISTKFRIRLPEKYPKKNNYDTFDLIKKRHSCRSFQIKKLSQSHLNEIINSVKKHTSEAKIGQDIIRFEYISSPINVWPVVNATEFLVAISPKEYKRETIMDVGRTLQKIVLDATKIGIGTCWIGPGADHNSISRSLDSKYNESKDNIICVCAIGYKSNYIPLFLRIFNKQMRRRLPLDELFFFDVTFETPLNLENLSMQKFGRNFEICQWAPSSFNGQTTRMISRRNKAEKIIGFDFYTTTTSRYYAPIALGIWLAHWELGCKLQNIKGHFEIYNNVKESNTVSYKYDISWIID